MNKFVLAILLCINYSLVFGQQIDSLQRENKRINFGFLFGINKITSSSGNLGFSFGAAMEYKIKRKLFLQPNFVFSFFDYTNYGIQNETSAIEFQLNAVFKPFKNIPTKGINNNASNK